jgi:hypothetical protein
MARNHQAAQDRRLRAALDELPAVVSPKAMVQHMEERGFERDMMTGKWRARRR